MSILPPNTDSEEQRRNSIPFSAAVRIHLNRWLGVRLETLGTLCTLVAAVVAVESRGSASDAGLVLSYAMTVTILMSILLRSMSTVENNVRNV
jgi:ATP-binding cassette subfamily C (CFTR/MRP) protein 1